VIPEGPHGEPNGPWFGCLPSYETSVPCGDGQHIVRWEAGTLQLPSHPDVEGELVLAALGGGTARCLELAEAWAQHTDDLSVLAIWPRSPADEITIGWEDVAAVTRTGAGARSLAGRPGTIVARTAARHRQMHEEMLAAQRRRDELLTLLALGYGFGVRLSGQVAAAHAADGQGREDGPPGQRSRPALVAAIAGRLAPAAEQWLGIDPDQVDVRVHQGPGWGSVELTGQGADRRLSVSLPAGWLASVWACGLTLASRHLIVAVEQPGWPRARVLGLRAPGAEPELIEVSADAGGPRDVPHWTV
jgi:hypothetical protein